MSVYDSGMLFVFFVEFMWLCRMTLVEPGPVVTEFERKVYEEAADMDLSGTDEETAKIFKQIYLPYSRKVFTSLGQTPEEVAEVRRLCSSLTLDLFIQIH